MNEEHFTFHLQYKHSGTFANRKYEELPYPQKSENVRPHSSNSIEMRPHSSQSSRENATPSSSISPLAIHTYMTFISTISKYLKLQTAKIPNHMWLISY